MHNVSKSFFKKGDGGSELAFELVSKEKKKLICVFSLVLNKIIYVHSIIYPFRKLRLIIL